LRWKNLVTLKQQQKQFGSGGFLSITYFFDNDDLIIFQSFDQNKLEIPKIYRFAFSGLKKSKER
jgi:hypothetical protein